MLQFKNNLVSEFVNNNTIYSNCLTSKPAKCFHFSDEQILTKNKNY